jgi:hypothetical protein
MTNKDWLPKPRQDILTMTKNWIQTIGGSATVWSVPLPTVHQLTALAGEAETALADAQNETTRTPVATAHCKEAFKALENHMRDLKKRYLYVPPLTDAGLVSLDLKIPDTHPTPSGTPTAQVTYVIWAARRGPGRFPLWGGGYRANLPEEGLVLSKGEGIPLKYLPRRLYIKYPEPWGWMLLRP